MILRHQAFRVLANYVNVLSKFQSRWNNKEADLTIHSVNTIFCMPIVLGARDTLVKQTKNPYLHET